MILTLTHTITIIQGRRWQWCSTASLLLNAGRGYSRPVFAFCGGKSQQFVDARHRGRPVPFATPVQHTPTCC